MGAACSIIRDDNNDILWTEAPNGSRSILFDNIVEKVGNTAEALPIWLASKTKEFKDRVINPKLNSHRVNILNKLNGLTTKQQSIEVINEGGKKYFRGVGRNYKESTNSGMLWVTDNESIAKDYADIKDDGTFNVQEINADVKSPFIFTYKNGNTSVTTENIVQKVQLEIIKKVKSNELSKEQYKEVKKLIDTYVREDVTKSSAPFHTKINEGVNSKNFAEVLKALGYDAVQINQDGSKTFGLLTTKPQSVELDLSNIEYTNIGGTTVGSQALTTITAFARPKGGGVAVKLGRIRYKIKGDTLVVDSSTLAPLERYDKGTIKGIQSLGIGGKLYAQLFKYALSNGLKVESSTNLSPASTALWNKMTSLDIATKTQQGYKVDLFPDTFDENGEIKMPGLLDFIDREGVGTGLTAKEEADVKVLMIGLPVKSTDELLYKLKIGFMGGGYFAPTRDNLVRSGLYNSEEITDIMTNEELQAKIRDYIYKLENMEKPINNEIYTDETYLTVKTGEKNSIGKFVMDNPYLIEKQVIQSLGGIELRSNFEERMMDDDLASGTVASTYTKRLDTPGDLFYILSKFKPVGALLLEENQIVPKLNETRETFEQTITDPSNGKLEKGLDFLIGLDDSMWREAPKEVTTLIKEVTKDLVDMGIDATDLLKVAQKKSIEETKSFLTVAREAAIELNQRTFDNLVGEYNEYFDVESSYKYEKVNLPDNITKDNTFHLETNLSGPELYAKVALVPVGKNIYKRVRSQSSSNLIDAVVTHSFASNGYETIVPLEAFRPAGFDPDGKVNMSKIQDRNNALSLRESVENWVDGQVKNVYVEGLVAQDIEELKKYILNFNYYNRSTEYNKFDVKPKMSSEYGMIVKPVQNKAYLTTKFIADFNKKIISEKQKGSEEYKNFYSNFKVTNQGISLINEDPISKAAMEPYFEDNQDIVDYFKIHKQREPLVEDKVEVPIIDDLFLRNYYSNYPTALKAFKGEYSQLTPNTLVVNSKESFIRTPKGVFEFVKSQGELGLYGRVETNLGMYKSYNIEMTPPKLDASTKILSGLDTNIQDVTKVENLYTEAEQKRIDDKYDNCR